MQSSFPNSFTVVPLLLLLCACVAACLPGEFESGASRVGASWGERRSHENFQDWSVYRGDKGGLAYSALDQINKSNVHLLEVAWIFHTGDGRESSSIQSNPIVIDRTMYVVSPGTKLIALDPATGVERWRFDPEVGGTSRGIAYWEDGEDRRIFFSAGPHLHALNADTGRIIDTFGEGGAIDLRQDLDREGTEQLSVHSTSPGVVFKDLIILGSTVSEGPQRSAPGHIRAYDVRNGKRAWIFHTIPHPGEFGYETWEGESWRTAGGVNAWAGLTLDEQRGLVFAATGSPSFDFYGGDRKGQNLFGNSILALDAETGERVWHFQLVHHDLWDYDPPAPPNLVTVTHDGRQIDAVAQITKTGHTFLLHRETGEPLFPVEERPVPASDLPGEETWPTQPFPVKPPPYTRQGFTEADITDISPEAHEFVRKRFETARGEHLFTPPSREGTIYQPGFTGGAEWGGAAFDPPSGILYVRSSDVPWIVKMVPPGRTIHSRQAVSSGERIYRTNCASCHGLERAGAPPTYPSLVDIGDRRSRDEVKLVVEQGQGLMPAFSFLSVEEKDVLVAYLLGEEHQPSVTDVHVQRMEEDWQFEYPFVNAGRTRFQDHEGYPAIKPPWSTLNAINLNTGEIDWRITLGEYKELTARGIPITGTESIGGPIVTAGGLVFIGATQDEKFHAFDKDTGALLWETQLPAGGYATPSTYEIDGKQYVVIAAGGGSQPGTRSGDAFVAFALPD